MKLIDISMSLNAKTPPWPGDQAFSYKLTSGMEETGSVNVGQFQTSNHTGTHVDAPFHYDNDGSTIGELPIERFIGDALVVNVENKSMIEAGDLEPFKFEAVTKVLFRSLSWENRSEFPGKYTVISEDVAPFLKEKGIDLIGIDTPSVDSETSKNLPAHHSFKNEDILILEGLDLDHVSPGIYELMTFPLKMDEADGSPVRAVLRHK
ncbi:arylformamidase [Halobacillus sp. A5]|uniref:arylformamidase n=1 Tax=Halobacillus sp. A5 TaxID=2880263 RepID=UPI0020A6C1CE|nr:arylformamidase [Halobacillus sp. A5]MCP3027464.1 arylformamidase [Halobacillus sp. A5]